MQIDPRLNDIDDCLYRVAVRALIIQDGKVLLVKESTDDWWALPGGGVDHGESVAVTLRREVKEELGVPAEDMASDFRIAYYNIGQVVNGVPRMNVFFKVTIPENSLSRTEEVADWAWFTKDEFMNSPLHASYDKNALVQAIFSDSSSV